MKNWRCLSALCAAWLLSTSCLARAQAPTGAAPASAPAATLPLEDEDPATIRAADLPADAPRFADYPATPVWRGQPAVPDVRSEPRSRLFRTMLRRGAAEGPNFAGHYTIVSWGCGSGCAGYAIVDARSGRVFHPENFQSNVVYNTDDAIFADGAEAVRFRLDSRLLIVIGAINEESKLRGVSYFVWNGRRLDRVRFVARPDTEIVTQ